MTDRHQPATRGELCSHPLHPRAWDDPQDTPTPAGGPISPQIPGGPESGSPSSRPACSLSAGERGSPRAWSASLQWVEQAAGRPCPWGGSALGARPADAARVTAHTGRPHPLGSLMAGSTAQTGCPECLPCWSQHHLCRRKAALECVGGGLVLPGDVITAQLQGTSHWPSAHPKSFASASSWNFPQVCSSRPWGSTLTSPQCPALSWKQQTGTSEGSTDTRDLCAQGSPPPLPHDNFLHLALLPHPWKKNSRGIPAGRSHRVSAQMARISEASAAHFTKTSPEMLSDWPSVAQSRVWSEWS